MYMNQHTLSDVRDLIRAKDYLFSEMQKSFDAVPLEAFDRSKWDSEFQSMVGKYKAARTIAQLKIGTLNGFIPGSTILPEMFPAPDDWDRILTIIAPSQELYIRLLKMGAHIDDTKTPQPSLSADLDIQFYKGSGAIIKAGEGAAKDLAKQGAAVRDSVFTRTNVTIGIVGVVVAGAVVYGIKKNF